MKIIIVGCGKVGSSLTEQLSREGHDICLIDRDEEELAELQNAYDVMGVVGNGASYTTLQEADIESADLLIAVTDSDELNLLCCTVAKRGSNCACIARVRDPEYSMDASYLRSSLGLAMIINPELESAWEIARILGLPNALDVNAFAHGQVSLIRFKINPKNELIGRKLLDFGKKIAGSVLICGVERKGEVYIPSGNFVIEEGDVVSVVAERRNAKRFFGTIGVPSGQVKSAMIIGGGRSTYYLARRLQEMGISVKIIERDRGRCEKLAEDLHNAVIINGDGTNVVLLREEGIDYIEGFIPMTGIDEQNILLTLRARTLTQGKTITRISRTEYTSLLSELDLGSVIDSKTITVEAIVAYVRAKSNSRGGNIETLYHLYDGRVEAIEFEVNEGKRVTGQKLMDLEIKNDTLISFINRNGRIIIPGGQDIIRTGDTVMVVTKHLGLQDIDEIVD